jgi:hypothetical protein
MCKTDDVPIAEVVRRARDYGGIGLPVPLQNPDRRPLGGPATVSTMPTCVTPCMTAPANSEGVDKRSGLRELASA